MWHSSQEEIIQFGNSIMEWARMHPRSLPWKKFSDPYSIWIAEIILQQTRVEQGGPYFEKFIKHFPTLQSLATATPEEVMILWEGLGYYSRARNLHHTARFVWHELGGRFPDNSTDLQRLKGIGPYTAAAIASFAFGEETGVVDGNVKRVVARYFYVAEDVESTAVKRGIQELVNRVVAHIPSPEFNQAIMDFGAMNCTPHNPLCEDCPASQNCQAYNLDVVDQLPVKGKTPVKQERWLNFGVHVDEGRVALIQNTDSNIWKNLHLFPVLGVEDNFRSVVESPDETISPELPLLDRMEWILSHRKLNIQFFHLENCPSEWIKNDKIQFVETEKLNNFALPRPLRLFLNQNSRKLGININHDQQSNFSRTSW